MARAFKYCQRCHKRIYRSKLHPKKGWWNLKWCGNTCKQMAYFQRLIERKVLENLINKGGE